MIGLGICVAVEPVESDNEKQSNDLPSSWETYEPVQSIPADEDKQSLPKSIEQYSPPALIASLIMPTLGAAGVSTASVTVACFAEAMLVPCEVGSAASSLKLAESLCSG